MGYVAGIGRGATGFTTSLEVGTGRIVGSNDEDQEDEEVDDERFGDADQGLLKTSGKDLEDDEADKIYEEIELRLLSRNKKRVRIDDVEEPDAIGEQFKDLKQALSTVSETEWLNLPEVGDLTRRNKRHREELQLQQRFYAVPDSVAVPKDTQEMTNFKTISDDKYKLLELELDTVSKSSAVDSNEYLNDLDQMSFMSLENVGNVKRARLALASLRKSQPKRIDGWIGSARLEESCKKLETARNIIQQGCEENPLSDLLWLENIRLSLSKDRKDIVRQLLTYIPKSEKLWLKLFELETDEIHQKRTLRNLISNIPESLELWREAISIETDLLDKKKLLELLIKLTNCLEFWFQLIDLQESIDESKKLLNEARKQNPESIDIWIHGAKIEERSTGNEVKISKLLSKGIKTVQLTRDDYIKKAIALEEDKFPISCSVVIQNVMDLGLERTDDNEKLKIWTSDAKIALDNKFIETGKSMFRYILMKFPHSVSIWKQYLKFIKLSFPDELNMEFQQVTDLNPETEFFWLWFAKEQMNSGKFEEAREILSQALQQMPKNEDIVFALIKLEQTAHLQEQQQLTEDKLVTTNYYGKISTLYTKGIEEIGTVRMYYKYTTFLRVIKDNIKLLEVVKEAISRFPDCFKLYLQCSQIYVDTEDKERAKDVLGQGVLLIPDSVVIWLALARIEESRLKQNAILDRGLLKNPKSALLMREKFRIEKQKDVKIARNYLLRLMKILPNSPELWCERLLNLETKSLQKTSFRQLIVATNDNPTVLNTIGYILWQEGKISRCKNFFDKSLELNPDIGDTWILLYLFLSRHGDPEELDKLVQNMEEADPRHGEVWPQVNKQIQMNGASRREIVEQSIKFYV